MRFVAAVLFAFFVAGCVHTYDVDTQGTSSSSAFLKSDSRIIVGLPKDGRYGDRIYSGSGHMAAEAVASAFSSRAQIVEMEETRNELPESLQDARARGADYYIRVEILHWEDRATEWSGLSDKVTIKLLVINSETEAIADSVTIDGKSRWATFGGDHPQDLLEKPLQDYVSRLFI